MRTSLRTQLSLAFGLLVVVLAGALSIGLTERYARAALADRGDALQALAGNTATMLADGLFERMREVELLAAAPPRTSTGEVDAEAWGEALERVQATRPQYSWIGVADPAGKVLTATGGLLVGKDVSQRPWFQGAREKPYTGDVHLAKLLATLLPPSASGEPLRFLDFAAPIRDARGTLQVVLGVHATWDWAHVVVNALRSQRDRDKRVMVFIIDRGGEVIYRPLGVSAQLKPTRLDSLPEIGGADLLWTDDEHYLTAAAKLPARTETTDMKWTVVTRQPMASALSASRTTQLQFMAIGALAGLLAIAQAFWLARRLTRPLSGIARAARSVASGDLGADIPALRTSKEISHLSTALRAMKSSLLEREAALASANADLEIRVLQRTAELGAAHENLERTNEALVKLVQRDALTGIHNRRAADERMSLELARHRQNQKPLSVLMLDVDHFKSVNDTLGHQAGDEVLKALAARLTEVCRATDFVARLGGEEFLVLLPETPLDGALLVGEKIRAGVASAPLGPTRATVSIGVTSPAEQLADETTILRVTDEALYSAKRNGRNRVECSAAVSRQAG